MDYDLPPPSDNYREFETLQELPDPAGQDCPPESFEDDHNRDNLDERITGLIQALREIRDQDPLAKARETGRLVIERLFDGDVRQWQCRDKRDRSYVRLENHPHLPMDATELYRSVRVYELRQRMPHAVIASELTISHFNEVLSVETTSQAHFLARAAESGWTIRELRKAIRDSDAPANQTGRPKTPPILKTLTGPVAANDAFDGARSLIVLEPAKALELLSTCTKAKRAIEEAEAFLKEASDRSKRQKAGVLLVDGDSDFAVRAQTLLKREGWRVRIAESCSQAVARVNHLTRLVVIELSLVDGSSVELSKRLLDQNAQLSFIFISGQPKHSLPAELGNLKPLVDKASGLLELRIALATALLDGGVRPDSLSS